MKHLYLTLCLMACSLAAAATGYSRLSVEMTDGSSAVVDITGDLQLTFNDTQLLITGGGADLAIDRAGLASFSHIKSAGAGAVKESAFAFDGTSLTVPGGAGGPVRVYTVDGRLVAETGADNAGRIDLSGLAAGIYTVRTDAFTCTLMKR